VNPITNGELSGKSESIEAKAKAPTQVLPHKIEETFLAGLETTLMVATHDDVAHLHELENEAKPARRGACKADQLRQSSGS